MCSPSPDRLVPAQQQNWTPETGRSCSPVISYWPVLLQLPCNYDFWRNSCQRLCQMHHRRENGEGTCIWAQPALTTVPRAPARPPLNACRTDLTKPPWRTGGYGQPRFCTGLTGEEEESRPKCPRSACLSSSAELPKLFTALVGVIWGFHRKWHYRGREALQFSLKTDTTVTDVLASSQIQLNIQTDTRRLSRHYLKFRANFSKLYFIYKFWKLHIYVFSCSTHARTHTLKTLWLVWFTQFSIQFTVYLQPRLAWFCFSG